MPESAASLQTRLDAYKAAELKILSGQEYQIDTGNGSRRLKRADLVEVRAAIESLQAQLDAASGTRVRVRRIVFDH
jgi:hypothetical protein